MCESHGAEDIDDDHDDREGDNGGGGEGAEEDGGEEEDDSEGGAEESAGERFNGSVLVEEDVEFGVGEDGDVLGGADAGGYTAG